MKNVKILLAADAVINLLIGTLLIFFPTGILDLFGLPQTNTYFYSSILGGVIFGIGIALSLECWGPAEIHGLGFDRSYCHQSQRWVHPAVLADPGQIGSDRKRTDNAMDRGYDSDRYRFDRTAK